MKTKTILSGIVLAFVLGFFFTTADAHAADARKFNAGNIIDDSVFTNRDSMTVAGIQQFLESKVKCDTWGSKRSELGGGTRAQWMNARGITAPFRCVTDYRENPSTGQTNYGTSTNPAGSLSAAEIIYNYSRQFNINPQVIIVTLQKENGLITDEWPTPKQYSEAMGFGCPDNVAPGAPACDPQYGSFSAQVYQAARHFRGYIDKPAGWWVPFSTGWNSIAWNPNAGCGRGDVFIENRATVALYSYTPYQPNQAAKNAQYGTGDSCSAYGNRNFFLYFTDWFGSPYGDVHMVSSLTLLSSAPGSLYTNGFVEASFIIRNDSDQWKDAGYVAVAVRDEQGRNHDFSTERILLAPHQEFLYRKARNFTDEGKYTFWVTSYRDEYGWSEDYPSSVNGAIRQYRNTVIQNKPSLAASVTSQSDMRHGKSSTLGFTVKNNSIYPVNLGYLGIAVRDPDGANEDLLFDTVTALAPGANYVYSKQLTPKKEGVYTAYLSGNIEDRWTTQHIDRGTSIDIVTPQVKPKVTITEGLSIKDVFAGEESVATFKVKNHASSITDAGYLAVAVRDPDGKNVDISGVTLDTLDAGQEYTFSGERTFSKPGLYTAWLVASKDGAWSATHPQSETQDIKRQVQFRVKTNPTLIEGMSIKRVGTSDQNMSNARAGDLVEGSFKIKNQSNAPVTVNKSLCYILRGGSKNNDLGCLEVGTLAANEERTFTAQKRIGEAGGYKAFFSMYDGGWRDNETFSPATGTEVTSLSFVAWANVTIVQGISLDDQGVGSFAVKNQSNTPATVNKALCMIVRRDGSSENYDYGCLDIKTLQGGQTTTFSAKRTLPKGNYRAYFSVYADGRWQDNTSFLRETGSETTELRFTKN